MDTLTGQCAKSEVHVIGIYQSMEKYYNYGYLIGKVNVKIEEPGKHILVLSANDMTTWRIELASGVTLEAIHLIGFNKQAVIAPYDTMVMTNLTGQNGACGYTWPYTNDGCDTNKLLSLARQYAGGEITSYYGCYNASRWTINFDHHAPSNCDTSSGHPISQLYPTCAIQSRKRRHTRL